MIEILKKDLAILKRQRREALAAYHQTTGAIDYLSHLIKQAQPELTEEEFAEMIAGKGATVTYESNRTD